jgi:hypothetical protein
MLITLFFTGVFSFLLFLTGVEAGEFPSIERLTSHIFGGGPPVDGIPAITNPEFTSPSNVTYVKDDDLVLGVVMNGEVRAYPENLGWWHEIINDVIGDHPISVTFCPLTGTGLVFDARDRDGSQIEFGVSGLLINSNLVMYDRRDTPPGDRPNIGTLSLYPQMLFTGITGRFKGNHLTLLSVIETTWATWKRLYPTTQVVVPGTGLSRYDREIKRDYTRYPYGSYRTNGFLLFTPTTSDLDERYHTKATLLGICSNGVTKAYVFPDLPERAVINDEVGGRSLAVIFVRELTLALPYDRRVDGRLLTFYQTDQLLDDLPMTFADLETRTVWNLRGEAIRGPLKGKRLVQVPAYNAFWFAWAAYWPKTAVWATPEGIISGPPISTAVEGDGEATTRPVTYQLTQNTPNPFNAETTITYALPVTGKVRLTVYDLLGHPVRTLLDEEKMAGHFSVRWDGRDGGGRDLSSGVYFYRFAVEGRHASTKRMVLLK